VLKGCCGAEKNWCCCSRQGEGRGAAAPGNWNDSIEKLGMSIGVDIEEADRVDEEEELGLKAGRLTQYGYCPLIACRTMCIVV